MFRKTNSNFDIKKYKQLHIGMSINARNEEESAKDKCCSESDQGVTFGNSLSVS